MSSIKSQISKLKRMLTKAQPISIEEYKKEGDLMTELNRKQLLAGKDAFGDDMPQYVFNSRSPSAPGNIKLLDTGDFHAGIKPSFDGGGIMMISTDGKFSFLDLKYDSALGLSPESMDTLVQVVTPKIRNRMHSI